MVPGQNILFVIISGLPQHLEHLENVPGFAFIKKERKKKTKHIFLQSTF